ncbi:caldesmon 1 [Rhinolophus ferrumequinum]|uniref:Caldesmon 1 n=1 Tax=Rhinolophus ferrumequinum TaxID=59479 RepID=A0A7J7RI82_RHIFE|nr:caldesmon 1 [Rhinolophus ferrumequinum]
MLRTVCLTRRSRRPPPTLRQRVTTSPLSRSAWLGVRKDAKNACRKPWSGRRSSTPQ